MTRAENPLRILRDDMQRALQQGQVSAILVRVWTDELTRLLPPVLSGAANREPKPCPAGPPIPPLTAVEINALPDRVRQYIHMLETDADPAGTIRQLVSVKDQNQQLQIALSEASAAVRPQEKA